MSVYMLEDFDESQWDTVYRLADAAIPFDLAGNRQTIDRRKSFDAAQYARRHYSVLGPSASAMIGYGAVEQQADNPASFRMFIILLSGDLWETAGDLLYQRLLGDLYALNARLVWWREYADDLALVRFVKTRGFTETDRVIDLRAPLPSDSAALIVQGFQPTVRGDEQQVILRSSEQQALQLAEQSGFQQVFSYVRLEKSLA
ncbi:MAG: hypothetical protein ABI835_11125 [Chloroflexota bacterium]